MKWNDKVKKLMEQKNITQKKLSELSGITETSVSRYLRGNRTPRMDVMVNFSKALGVATEYLLENDKETGLTPYAEISTVIARRGKELSVEEKNKLIALILGNWEDMNV